MSQADSGVLNNIMICPNPKCNNTRTDTKSEKQEAKGKEVKKDKKKPVKSKKFEI